MILRFAVLTMILGLLISPIPVSRTAATPLVFPNGGFEIDPTHGSNGWSWVQTNWEWDGNVARSGTHSARVYRDPISGPTASIWSAAIPVQASTIYTLNYWLRTQDATFWPSVSVYQFDSGQIQTGPRQIAHANVSGGMSLWNQVQYRFQTMPDASFVQVRVALWDQASGTYWFDDFGLQQESQARFPFHPGFPVVSKTGSIFHSSPVIADIDNNGTKELLIAGGYAINGWDQSGSILPGFPLSTGDKHIQSQVTLADLDGNGDLEISAGTKSLVPDGQGRIFLWHHTGQLLSGWPKTVAWDTQYANNESLVGTIVMADIDGDTDLEIVAGTSNNTAAFPGPNPPAAPNLYAWHADGTPVSGEWPTWYSKAGIYGQIAAADLNGDGMADIEVGRDHHYLTVYGSDGSHLPGWPIETYLLSNAGRYNEDPHVCYAISAPVVADLDGDGEMEYVIPGFLAGPVSGTIYNSSLLVLEPDGTRRPGWETPALGTGILDLEDLSLQAPAVADLNGDGQLEIVVPTNDGWIRAYKPDKSLLWAFNYAQGAVLGATEPAVGDIDGDGSSEVVFGTRVPSQEGGVYYSGPVGLWALRSNGTVVPGFPLPIPTPGMFGAPTLGDFDSDGQLEILAAAREGSVFIWDTPTPYDSLDLPWPTGRHDLRRSAAYTPLIPLEASHKTVSPRYVQQGETASFSIHIANHEPLYDTFSLTDSIPAGTTLVPGSLAATSGITGVNAGVVHWSGTLSSTLTVEITYDVIVTTANPMAIRNTAVIDTITHGLITRPADLFANYSLVFLPVVGR